jgi:hypothetical protein
MNWQSCCDTLREEYTMGHIRILTVLGLAAAVVAAPSSAQAQVRGRAGSAVVGHAAPLAGPSPIVAGPRAFSMFPYAPFYRSGIGFGFYLGYPGYYGPYGYGYPYYYPYGVYPYGYAPLPGYFGATARAYGGVRINMPQKDAEVYTDGYYAGTVKDFDGTFHHLDMAAGPHHIEIRAQGFDPMAFDVNVQPGQTITYRSELRKPRP